MFLAGVPSWSPAPSPEGPGCKQSREMASAQAIVSAGRGTVLPRGCCSGSPVGGALLGITGPLLLGTPAYERQRLRLSEPAPMPPYRRGAEGLRRED